MVFKIDVVLMGFEEKEYEGKKNYRVYALDGMKTIAFSYKGDITKLSEIQQNKKYVVDCELNEIKNIKYVSVLGFKLIS